MSADDRKDTNEVTDPTANLPIGDLNASDVDPRSAEQVKGGDTATTSASTTGKVKQHDILITKTTDG